MTKTGRRGLRGASKTSAASHVCVSVQCMTSCQKDPPRFPWTNSTVAALSGKTLHEIQFPLWSSVVLPSVRGLPHRTKFCRTTHLRGKGEDFSEFRRTVSCFQHKKRRKPLSPPQQPRTCVVYPPSRRGLLRVCSLFFRVKEGGGGIFLLI